jgi:hypothetical protein
MAMKRIEQRTPVQLSLFEPVVLDAERLMATESPRCAVYTIWLVREPGGYVVKKESGAAGQKLIGRAWRFDNRGQAEDFFKKKVREKTNPNRKARVYHCVSDVKQMVA